MMTTDGMTGRTAEGLPRFKGGITAAFYLLTILMGGVVLLVHGRLALAVDLIATTCYIAVTALFYDLSRPVNRSLTLLAVFFNMRAERAGRPRATGK
jgi:hypothetical protein